MARATSSLPVPVSPVMRTVESLGATLDMRERTLFRAGEDPTISSNIEALSISSRSATFSLLQPLLGLFAILDIGSSDVPRVIVLLRSRNGLNRKRNQRYSIIFAAGAIPISTAVADN